MSEGRLLIVEDEVIIQRLLRSQLKSRGFDVHVVAGGYEALNVAADEDFDLMLVDLKLLDLDGLEVCRQIREWSTIPIIVVTGDTTRQTIIQALETGADDYVTKPFHLGELVARIRAVMRRAKQHGVVTPNVVNLQGLNVHIAKREVVCDEQPVALTRTEFDLLKELVTHPEIVLTYQHLLQAAWGSGYEDVHTVQVHICHLRRKLSACVKNPVRIVAVNGIGYLLKLDS